MKDEYYEAFFDVVKNTQQSTGFELPQHVEAYIVMLLSDFVDRSDIPPDDTFAHMFFTLQSKHQAKELGDLCLVISGAFPQYKKRYGITKRYYQDIGTTSYEIASPINEDLFPLLSKNFVFLSKFIELTVSSSKLPPNNLFH